MKQFEVTTSTHKLSTRGNLVGGMLVVGGPLAG